MNPRFSVIVPIYNVEKYLKKCIDSILAQTYLDFEVLLIDDGSPDNCPMICDEYAGKDRRVRVIHKKNAGLVAARNSGVLAARGEYICYVDGDDWVSPDLLQVISDKAISQYNIDMVVFSAVKQYENEQEEIPKPELEGYYGKEELKSTVYPYMMYDCRKPFCSGLIFPVAWNKIYKRVFLLEHYCQEERIRMGEDNAFVYECLYASNSVYFCSDILYYYNQLNVTSMVHSYDSNRFVNNAILTRYIDERMGGKDNVIDEQINAFKAYWLIMAVFHEMKAGRNIRAARKHISKEIKNTKVLEGIKIKGLPKMAQGYLLLLRFHFYGMALLAAKLVSSFRK